MPYHKDTKNMPFTADQLFALVADVDHYSDFIPWCAASRVKKSVQEEENQIIEADLVIAFKVFRERFASRVILNEQAKTIHTRYIDGPFKYLVSEWEFKPTAQGCEVTFMVDFEFRNAILQGLIGMMFMEAMHRIMHAFEQRAKALYGASPALPPAGAGQQGAGG